MAFGGANHHNSERSFRRSSGTLAPLFEELITFESMLVILVNFRKEEMNLKSDFFLISLLLVTC
jgi:hypothetical protein